MQISNHNNNKKRMNDVDNPIKKIIKIRPEQIEQHQEQQITVRRIFYLTKNNECLISNREEV